MLSSNCFCGAATNDDLSSMEAATIITSVVDWRGGCSAVIELHQRAAEGWHAAQLRHAQVSRSTVQALRRNQTLHAA